MKPTQKIQVEIPNSLYEELKKEDAGFSEIVNLALQEYLKKNNKKNHEEELKKGYEEMGPINLGLANLYLEADHEALSLTERYLTECE